MAPGRQDQWWATRAPRLSVRGVRCLRSTLLSPHVTSRPQQTRLEPDIAIGGRSVQAEAPPFRCETRFLRRVSKRAAHHQTESVPKGAAARPPRPHL